MFRDRGSLRVEVTESEGIATTAKDTLKVLNELKQSARLPLVVGTDNGSPLVAKIIAVFMRQNKIVHLKSLPRVPQHNGSAENAVGDVKRLIRDGETSADVCRILNDCRVRQTLNWKTPTEVDLEAFQPWTKKMRTLFYNATKLAIKRALICMKTAYEKRKAEREAIFQTMESFSLITRTRGHRQA